MQPLTPEQKQLAAELWPLAVNVARKFGREQGQRQDVEGYVSDAALALVHAVRSYNPTMRVPLVPFAAICIARALLRSRWHCQPRGYRQAKEKPPRLWPLKEGAVAAPAPAEPFDEMIGNLDPCSQRILQEHYVGGYRHREIAKHLRVTSRTERKLHARAMQQLRQEYDA